MKTLTKLSLLILISLSLASCLFTGVVGSRNVTTESRNISEDFTGIKVSQGIEVQLTQDREVSLSAEMDDNLHDILVTEVVDGVLKIYFDENVGRRKSSTIYLNMPKISSVKTSSGSEVKGTKTFKVNELLVDSSSGSEVSLRVEANRVECESSSGSDILLMGTTQSLRAKSSSGSDIDTKDLLAKEVEARASSGSSIDVYATESFSGSASSGASIDCSGDPQNKSQKKSSGGSISIR